MYITTPEQMEADQQKYRKEYQPFRPFVLKEQDLRHIAFIYSSILSTQNGSDTDDYSFGEQNKITKFLKDIPENSKVLLLGVGTGREILSAKDFGLDAYGLTLGSRNIDFGKKYLALEDKNFFEASLESLPFSKETFDAVAGFQVFEHAISPLLFLLEQGRVLKIGGKLILEWPPANDLFTGGSNPHHQVCYTPGQAKALFEKAGFINIKLFYDTLEEIPESEYWKGDQKHFLVIEGIKSNSQQTYIRKVWDSK